jgi:PilZ domain
MVVSTPDRKTREVLWRRRLTDAKLRLDFARNFMKEVQRDYRAGDIPESDHHFAYQKALRAERFDLAEYNKVLRIYTDLTLNGIVPDDGEWLKEQYDLATQMLPCKEGMEGRDHEGRSSMECRTERRSNPRYPIHLDFDFRLLPDERPVLTGRGRVVNLSSSGVLFECDSDLPLGMWIELSIDWPVMLNNEVRLKLQGKGRVVRVKGNRIAVTIERYDFLTRLD